MKKFIFTLQSLLDVKISLEKQYKAELAACIGRINAFKEELAGIHMRVEKSRGDLRVCLENGTNSFELQTYAIGFMALSEKILAQEQKIEVAEEDMRRIQALIVEVMGERKMLEKLKEKHFEEYKYQEKLENAVIIDDFISNKISDKGRS